MQIDDSVIIEQYHELRSCRAVAEIYGCSDETIRRTLIRNDVKLTGWKRPPKLEQVHQQRKETNRVKRQRWEGPVSYEKECKYCGKTFIAHNNRKQFCSRKCKDISIRLRKGIKVNPNVEPYKRKCSFCGKDFETFRDVTKCCCHECSVSYQKQENAKRDRKRAQYSLEEYKKIVRIRAIENAEKKRIEKERYRTEHTVERECEECGTIFKCLDYENRKTCSAECSRKRSNRARDKRIPKEQKVDHISLKRLFKRDSGKCYLCGCDCDFNDWNYSKNGNRYPGNTYPEIEHVIPVSKGGLHSWDNVRLACHKCNGEKADGIIKTVPMSKEFAYSQKFNKVLKKKTAQYSLDGNLIKVWDSTAQIKRELGLNDKHIQNVCRGDNSNTGNAYGYHWEYVG